MNYSDDHNTIFLLPPRQGTRSITSLLKYLGFKSATENPNFIVHDLKIPKGKEDYTIACTIRNPYKRYLSTKNLIAEWKHTNHPQYQDKDLESFSLDEWIGLTASWMYDYNKILSLDSQYTIDHFVDTSNLAEDLIQIPLFQQALGDPQFINLWDNNIVSNKYKIALEMGFNATISEQEANWVYKKFEPIFDKFGYDKNSWEELNNI